MTYLLIAAGLLVLMMYAIHRNTHLDVETGRRDSMSLRDDYGSNRGYYWPWTPIIQVCFFGMLICFYLGMFP